MNENLEVVKSPAVDVCQLDLKAAQEFRETEEGFSVDNWNQRPHSIEEGVRHLLKVLAGLLQALVEHLVQHGLASRPRCFNISLA